MKNVRVRLEERMISENQETGQWINDIFRTNGVYSEDQGQTQEAFGFKWAKRETYESENSQKATKQWLLNKYFGGNNVLMEELFFDGAFVLDAGCGSGFSFSCLVGDQCRNFDYVGVDISSAVDIAKDRFEKLKCPSAFMQASVLELPIMDESFDIVFSEGVLHHTDSVERGVIELTRILKKGGKLLFYVYAKKAPIREFCDDYIRDQLKDLTDEEAWDALLSLTQFGVTLGNLNMEIEIPNPIPLLGIPEGKVNLQRLFYYYMFKAYYRPDYTLDEMNHINFDWYRPLNCSRHTPDQIRDIVNRAGLRIERINVEESGISVIATK